MDLRPGQTLSHYRLLDKIGHGGMGVVYSAIDLNLDRRIAIKLLTEESASHPEHLGRFRREAKAVAALNHPNIVTLHSVEESEGYIFFTMEMVDGETLASQIPADGLPLQRILDVAIPIADALCTAHDSGIIHRDLKPTNVLVTDGSGVKILDFGLAKLTQTSGAVEGIPLSTAITTKGCILGTVSYMSPEQAEGTSIDTRTDIFSLGIVLYEMATGQRPFSGKSPLATLSAILHATPPPISELRADLPEELCRLIQRCLEKDPDSRYQSVLDLKNDLKSLKQRLSSGDLKAPSISARLSPSTMTGWRPWTGRRSMVITSLIVIVVGLVAFWMWYRRTPPATTTPATPASIAILPFVNLSPDPGDVYLSDGLTEELINAFARLEGVSVPARTTVLTLRNEEISVQEMGKRLGVTTLLEGSVSKAGDRLRINVRLISTSNGATLWAERYDRQLEDVLAIQDEISRQIVTALRVRLTPGEREALERMPTRDPQAYDLYLRGRRLFYMGGGDSWNRAHELFARASKVDPDFALAFCGLADTASMRYMYLESSEVHLEEAIKASLRAVELAPSSAEAHVSRGIALSLDGDCNDSITEFETAIKLDPRLFEAHYFYARCLWTLGRNEDAVARFEEAITIRPEDYQAPILLAAVFEGLQRTEEAVKANRLALDIIEKHLETTPDDFRALYMGARALVVDGQVTRGLEWAERAAAAHPEDGVTLYNVACIHAKAGKAETAIDYLERAVSAGFTRLEWIVNDNDLALLHQNQRFQNLVQSLK
jgi:non-specific serine/threonine protein kinase